jgi:hypothetical protein
LTRLVAPRSRIGREHPPARSTAASTATPPKNEAVGAAVVIVK